MKLFTLLSTVFFAVIVILLSGISNSYGDDDEHESTWNPLRTKHVMAAKNHEYQNECGACHMAYPPGLLPTRSWQNMMNNLDTHFGDNAELDAELKTSIMQYLTDNSADNSSSRLSRKIMRNVSNNETPLRISELPYMRHEHDEINVEQIKQNEKIGSLSNCSACHQHAEQGSFSEREINIPGMGFWRD